MPNQKNTGGVVLAYLTPDLYNAHFAVALNALLDWDSRNSQRIYKHGTVLHQISGPRIAAARNDLVRAFLRTDADWLLMLDSDMVFPPDLAESLVEAAHSRHRPVVGGLCFAGGRSGQIRPTLGVMVANDPPRFETAWNYQPNALNGVDYTGAACLLMHRTVLETLADTYGENAHPWFAESEIGGQEYGEDVTFCMRVRAAGFPIYVHTGIKVGHMKMAVIDEETYLTYRRGITDLGEDEFRDKELGRRFVGDTL